MTDRQQNIIRPEDECPVGGAHEYKSVYEDWDSETYQCAKCGDRYKLYDDEMR